MLKYKIPQIVTLTHKNYLLKEKGTQEWKPLKCLILIK